MPALLSIRNINYVPVNNVLARRNFSFYDIKLFYYIPGKKELCLLVDNRWTRSLFCVKK